MSYSPDFQLALNGVAAQSDLAKLVRPSDFWLDTLRGLYTGLSIIKRSGRNLSVGASFVPVSIGGVYPTPQSSAATALRIKAGGNVNDDAAGTGARQITIYGLDQNFTAVTEAIATAGASASASTSTTFTRVYGAAVTQSGSYATVAGGTHAGQITIENAAGTQDWISIDATQFPKGRAEAGCYSSEAGAQMFVRILNVSADTGKQVDILYFVRGGAGLTSAPYSPLVTQAVAIGIDGGNLAALSGSMVPFGPYTGPTDVGFLARCHSGTAAVSVEFEIILVEA